MRITFHIGKYTITIIVYERKKKATATLPSDGCFLVNQGYFVV